MGTDNGTSEDTHAKTMRWSPSVSFAILACACVLLLVRIGWGQTREAARRMDRGNLAKSVNLVAWLYAEEHDHVFPELELRPGQAFYDVRDVHPAYAIDGKLTGPLEQSHTPLLAGDIDGYKAYALKPIAEPADYLYTGYALSTESEVLAFAEACRKRIVAGQRFDADLPAEPGRGSFGGNAFTRLRSDLADILEDKGVADDEAAKQVSRIPVLIERPKPGPGSGGWVVYLDKRAEYLPYPGPFPMTEPVIAALSSLGERAPN